VIGVDESHVGRGVVLESCLIAFVLRQRTEGVLHLGGFGLARFRADRLHPGCFHANHCRKTERQPACELERPAGS
jgi:hypothetical protein